MTSYFFLTLKFGIVIIFPLFKIERVKRSWKPKTVCTYDKYWMRDDILKLEKCRVNKWDPPPFGNKPKLDCLFCLNSSAIDIAHWLY